MADPNWTDHLKDLVSVVKDIVTIIGIFAGGLWAIWKFGYTDLLRRRNEELTLEGSSPAPDLCPIGGGKVAVSLRWTWRNCGLRPIYVDVKNTVVEVYRPTSDMTSFVDPRQKWDEMQLNMLISHQPLLGFEPYKLELGTTSTLLTVPILPEHQALIARMALIADKERHPKGHDWSYSWERWQVFRTNPEANSK